MAIAKSESGVREFFILLAVSVMLLLLVFMLIMYPILAAKIVLHITGHHWWSWIFAVPAAMVVIFCELFIFAMDAG